MSDHAFVQFCKSEGLPEPVPEFRFHPVRKWRFDFAWPDQMIALEVEGGLWVRGRHNRASGFLKDMEKYNTAESMGWHVFRTTPKELYTQIPINYIRNLLKEVI